MVGQLDFFELVKTPLEKATTYEEIMRALGDECVECHYDDMGSCGCPFQCVLGDKFEPKK